MASIDRVRKAIAVMTRVRDRRSAFNMHYWQQSNCCIAYKYAEQELHKCGTAACFAGWLAVSPEFQADGGEVLGGGIPAFGGQFGTLAIALYLKIPVSLADDLCALPTREHFNFYGVGRSLEKITPQMVIDKLQEIIDNG